MEAIVAHAHLQEAALSFMGKLFLRLLIVNAVLQFVTTRMRAGRVQDEGAAEALWAAYPVRVIVNAFVWSLMISTIGRLLRPLRGRRA
jgi:hypothetical protein